MSEDDFPIEQLLADRSQDTQGPDTADRDGQMLGVSIVNWRDLKDADAPAVWRDLHKWVEWFLTRYEIPDQKIPPCWWQHPALVEELSALHTAWLVSFDQTDGGYGPIGWHERLTVTMQRVGAWYNGQCANGHESRPNARRGGATVGAGWPAWVTSSHAHPTDTTTPDGITPTVKQVGGYEVPVDPMDDTQCDSCQ